MSRHSFTLTLVFGIIVLMFLRLPQMVAEQDYVLNTYRALVEVDALAKQRYVEPIIDDRLVVGAMRGMLRQLDPYSAYLSADRLAAIEARIEGEYAGIGAEIGMRNGRPVIITPLDGSPAAQAGVRAGDRIVAIDGRKVRALSIPEIDSALRGEAGTTVRLTLQHADAQIKTVVEVVRDKILIETIRGFAKRPDGTWDFMIEPDDGVAYVRVSSFHKATARNFDRALLELIENGASAIILDLRFNPGGILAEAIHMVDRFVSDGVIVSTVTRRSVEHDFTASASHTITDWDLIVLINGGSASAAEVMAGSLQAHGRAIIVGERSFGKASVQRIIRLTTHNGGVKLTIAHYRLPNGRIIHRLPNASPDDDWGIYPDVEVVLSQKERDAVQQSRLATGPFPKDSVGKSAVANTPLGRATAEIERDRQLTTALDLLRRMRQGEDVSQATRN
ncbi:MAG: S41 family peptidase [Planctomycetes bacterium]|nr:S41 family peptidase [Planctomycetota bacterium]